MNRLPLHQKNLTAAGISALIVVVLFVSLGAKPRMQSSPNYEYKVLSQTKLIHEALMQAQQQAPQNQKKIVDIISQMSTMLDDSQAKKIEDTLNKLGSEGWELAGITEALYILKRPVK